MSSVQAPLVLIPATLLLVLACSGVATPTERPPVPVEPASKADPPGVEPAGLPGAPVARIVPIKRPVRGADETYMQPELFVPGEADSFAWPDGSTHPAPTPRTLTFDPPLPNGRRVDVYSFTRDPFGDYTHVLAVYDGERRIALFTHVSWYLQEPDTSRLLFGNWLRRDTDWQPKSRIYDVATGRDRYLQATDCVGGRAEFTDSHILLFGYGMDAESTSVCIFDRDGKAQSQIEFSWQNPMARGKVLRLPGNESVWAGIDDVACAVTLVHLQTQESRSRVLPHEPFPGDGDLPVRCPAMKDGEAYLRTITWEGLGSTQAK